MARVPGCRTEMKWVSCEVRTEFICYVEERRMPLWSSGQSSWLQNGDELSFLWGTNWIYLCYVEEIRPPLWSSVQSSWLQIQRSWFVCRRYQIFWVVGLEQVTLNLVSTIEELLRRKISCFGLKSLEYGRKYLLCWPRNTLYPQNLSLTSPTICSLSVGIFRSRSLLLLLIYTLSAINSK
jgi:hypothetical protein